MRRAPLLLTLLALPSFAQAIGGMLTTSFEGFNASGVPTVRLHLKLTCSLTCPPTKPELHFAVSGATRATFLELPTESTGYVSPFFGSEPSGDNLVDSMQFTAGTAFKVLSKSATCWCGNATGEGGYIDLSSNTVVPPWLNTSGTAKAGEDWGLIVSAKPQGGESVEVKVSGAGLDQTITFVPADFSNTSALKLIKPTSAGTLNLTATLKPYGASSTATLTVTGGTSGTGGGGASSTGGGNGGGGGSGGTNPAEKGCTSAPGFAFALAALLLRRR